MIELLPAWPGSPRVLEMDYHVFLEGVAMMLEVLFENTHGFDIYDILKNTRLDVDTEQ